MGGRNDRVPSLTWLGKEQNTFTRRIASVYLLAIAIAISVGSTGTPAQVTVSRIDGSSIVGSLSEWNEQGISVAVEAGEVDIAAKELLSLRWSGASVPPDASAGAIRVELTDGTVLPVDQFQVASSKALLTLPAVVPAEKREQQIAIRNVAAVQLRPLDGAVADQWSQLRKQEFTSDVLAVLKRDGKSLDYVEGVLGEVTKEKIEFRLDDESRRVDRSRVAGLIYLRADTQAKQEPICIIHSRAGLRASASAARLANELISVTTSEGVELDWPLEDIKLVDFSAGKILYLSDIEQATADWTPLVGLPSAAQAASKYGQPRRDNSAFGGLLTLSHSAGALSGGPNQLQSYNKGLALHSRTEMVFRLPAGYRRFLAIAGIEPATSPAGNVQFKIYGDDEALFEADIAGNEPPREIELDVAGVRRLKLVVDFGKNLSTGDWLNVCDARLVK
jgi:hypothetical protein